MKQAPEDTEITLAQLDDNPFPIYKRLRREAPVVQVKNAGRTFITKAVDTRYVKDNPEIFSSNDPNTPMRRAFWAHTLMRKDGQEHLRERMAMAPSFAPKVIRDEWVPEYEKIAKEYVARLPRGEVVDLFSALSGPYAARGLAIVLGIDAATDDQMQRWSQALIDGAGNFGWKDEPFQRADRANEEMHRLFDSLRDRHRAKPNNSALSVMLNADDPIEKTQIYANMKIAIGGGINEPRDALNTVLFGLLSNPEQLGEVKRNADWDKAFEEGIRWVAPISASSRLAVEDTEIRGCFIPKGDVVMTIQASANRDEDLFDDGESFFVYRNTNPHQSFGNGPHFCQGTHIARRAVAQVMLPILFDRFPNMSLPKPSAVNWRGFGFRGPLNLPVLLN
ncbi:Cytochrome P450-pinF2, plant-inducible [Rhodobacteraceae bacterium IMCC1933]|nr:Cytochrome P450-pinF2, plant-inducible [Rhodobacteraceae bacterium IMCC1923]MDP4069048.1 Cytochrome P450-pinF2, plant-inducible [Rhodobacteraceae bacterium IMCC1933]MDP4069578.1 Cytochrome P450-pinF2, plant-inducible [Rhodobacteraceae bacterium IMCC1909]